MKCDNDGDGFRGADLNFSVEQMHVAAGLYPSEELPPQTPTQNSGAP